MVAYIINIWFCIWTSLVYWDFARTEHAQTNRIFVLRRCFLFIDTLPVFCPRCLLICLFMIVNAHAQWMTCWWRPRRRSLTGWSRLSFPRGPVGCPRLDGPGSGSPRLYPVSLPCDIETRSNSHTRRWMKLKKARSITEVLDWMVQAQSLEAQSDVLVSLRL